jgi:hypothetical protein
MTTTMIDPTLATPYEYQGWLIEPTWTGGALGYYTSGAHITRLPAAESALPMEFTFPGAHPSPDDALRAAREQAEAVVRAAMRGP